MLTAAKRADSTWHLVEQEPNAALKAKIELGRQAEHQYSKLERCEIEAMLRRSQRLLARIGGGKCCVEGRVRVLQISRPVGPRVRRIESLQQRGPRDGETVYVAVFVGHARDGIAQQLMDPID